MPIANMDMAAGAVSQHRASDMWFNSVDRRLARIVAPISLGLVIANGAVAAEWTTNASVGTSLVYTDNACLSNDNKQSETYATATPRAGIRGEGRRANLSLSASLTGMTLSDGKLEDLGCSPRGDRERDNYFPRIIGNAFAELVEQWLYLDASVNVSQNDVNPFAPGAGDPEDRTGNTNTTYRYSISPYVSRRFKDAANLLLRYTWDDQYNTKDVVGDSSRQNVQFRLDSVPGTSKFSWGLQADYDEIDYSERAGQPDTTSELKSAQFNLAYQFNRSWQANGYAGEEWNDFVSISDEIDGTYWDVGLRWTPNARTVIDAGTGDRFYGSTYRFSIQYYHKRSALNASYSENLTYDRNIRTLDDEFFPGDPGGLPIDPETGLPIDLTGGSTTLSNSPMLDERFQLGYSFQGRRSSLSIVASQSDQKRLEDGRDSTFRRVGASLSRPLSSKWSASASVSWDEREPLGDRGESIAESETWRAGLSARRSLVDWINFTLRYQYIDRKSELESQEYQENRITATLRFTF